MANSVNSRNTSSTSGESSSNIRKSNLKSRPKRRLKKQIRRTFGGLFLASALIVAAIPAQQTQAGTGALPDDREIVVALNYKENSASKNTYIDSYGKYDETSKVPNLPMAWRSNVPFVDHSATIYTTQSDAGYTFQFAFVKPNQGASDEVAVILGAVINSLPNNSLTIPAKVDAYLKYSTNTTNSGYCAVNRDGKYLYYKDRVQKEDSSGYRIFTVPAVLGSTEVNEYYTLNDPETNDVATIEGIDYDVKTTVKHFLREKSPDILDWDYVTQTTVVKTNQITLESTSTVSETTEEAKPVMVDSYFPCFASDKSKWDGLSDLKDLYYWDSTDPEASNNTDFTKVTTDSENWIHDADVQYIGRQYLEGNDGRWTIKGEVIPGSNPSNGVFAGKTQIRNLTIGDNLLGIGDCAFYDCGGIESVTFGNGLNTIGNEAFCHCYNMTTVSMETLSEIAIIGKRAFADCNALTSIALPVGVQAIGDYCFSNCNSLNSIDLCGGGLNVALNVIGYRAFENCSSLSSITFPPVFKQDSPGLDPDEKFGIPITYFSGCSSLQFIKIQNDKLDIIDGNDSNAYASRKTSSHAGLSGDDINDFLGTVSDSFYFEGPASSTCPIHVTAKIHSASYTYYDEELGMNVYERVVVCPESPSHSNVFVVNDSNELVRMDIDKDCSIIEIPSTIGTHGISTLGEFSFQNKCNLKKVVIPSSVVTIEKNAFKGCHNLEDVVFEEPINITSIGTDAFATQEIGGKKCSRCNEDLTDATTTPPNNPPFLSFTGTISYDSEPFRYAMDPANEINNDFQKDDTYITFYSSWPTNLVVKYNPEIDKNELISYPKASDLTNYAVKLYDGTDQSSMTVFPAITDDYVNEAITAVSASEADRTAAQVAIINSAYNVVLPSGIEAIKEGIFSNVDKNGDIIDGTGSPKVPDSNNNIKTITIDSVDTIDPYTFARCGSLKGFYQNNSVASNGYSIGDYAFKDCNNLTNVEIGSAVSDLGLRPFAGCTNLTDVNFGSNPNYVAENQIIYGLDGGVKSTIVECLECRGSTAGNAQVGPAELETISSIYPEAFKNCDGVGQVDLSSSSVGKIPEQGFALMDGLYSVKLPESCKSITRGAFWKTSMSYMEVPSSVSLIQPEAFADVKLYDNSTASSNVLKVGDIMLESDGSPTEILNKQSGHKIITAYCVEDSAMDVYADDYYYINPEFYRPTIYHSVYFWDTYESTTNPTLIEEQKVIDGEDAVPPVAPEHGGITASGWTPNYTNIVRDTDVTTVYGENVHAVIFKDYDGTDLTEWQYIEDGKSAVPPKTNPHRDGFVFTGWSPDYRNIYNDGPIIAQYDSANPDARHIVTFYGVDGTVVGTYKVDDGDSITPPNGPERSGYKFIGWVPNDFTNITKDMTAVAAYDKIVPSPAPSGGGGKDGSASPSPSGSKDGNGTEVKTYTVSVSGGSGTGSYPAGQVVAINAYDMGTGQIFDKWTTSTAGVAFANPTSTSTFFTMPAANVAITATFKAGNKGGGNAGGNGGNANGNRGNTGTSSNPSGTKVEVTKGGISNTDLAGASVTGSTDNFVVKVTDDATAAELALRALQNRYGDVSRFKYLPFDVSLYDSTGRTKIADTTGLSVNITLPLPDELAPYAGNNKVASVLGGQIEDLNARYTTVNGVPCINFTAPHLSPYMIYVDTANLTEATIDVTPKTGDPIHPKWFLSIGLACISLIFFFKRDKRVAVKSA